ncbi:DUF6695 family protein [Aquimarina intermedia]|uniref:Uncharacterized protein n=1 Tax=Aquimarina intermedia TaxID=350814 RepID=A0A5S5CBB6_9FLAO|nr:DUF6695 family protein [Aquimarina intermedia]TYP75802.1 hypothetical protein BD809_1029 [Aquimarina intermedia]
MNTGTIIVLAFPDTFVRYSDESALHVFPYLGLGKNKFIKAGHAALVLIENSTGRASYYDFGRYVTPPGTGRVRSAATDVELELPFNAKFDDAGNLDNLKEFLVWLEANPEKTHGEGRLVASLCYAINFESAKGYLMSMQEHGSLPYRAFGKKGSNCSRLVTDTLIRSTTNIIIKLYLKRIKIFTPSPLGNVLYASRKKDLYTVTDGCLQPYAGSVIRENLVNYFDKKIPVPLDESTHELKLVSKYLFFLSGIGSSAYFYIQETQDEEIYTIRRYTEKGIADFEGQFILEKKGFNFQKDFEIIHDSNCLFCHVQQEGEICKLQRIKRVF